MTATAPETITIQPWEPDPAFLVRVIHGIAPAVAAAGQRAGLAWVSDGRALLGALAENESAFDELKAPRFEGSYYYGSAKYKAQTPQGQVLREAIKLQGALAACSWGPWQIMALNAMRFGYPLRAPLYNLWNPDVSGPYVAKLVVEILTQQRPPNPAEFGDAYNSGNWRDPMTPAVQQYEERFARHFADVVARRGL